MPPPRFSRRTALRTAAAVCAGTGLYAWQVEPHWAAVTQRVIPLANLPTELVGRRLVHLSDLHLGPVRTSYLAARLRQVAALSPWLTVITGDFLTVKHQVAPTAAAELLRHLNPETNRTLAVFGNHDYGAGWCDTAQADQLAGELSAVGVRVLRNESLDCDGLQVVGLDDLWAGRCDVAKTLEDVAPDRPAVALLHNPDGLDRPGWDNFHGWVFSGHTHGGQVRPPFLPPPLLPVRNRRYTSGHLDLGDGRQVYINRGLGYTTQVRFNVRPEIGVFELQRDFS